jgi:hypothetical protein
MGVKMASHVKIKTLIKAFKNRVCRRISGPKRDVVAGGCRKLRNEELRDFCCSPNNFRMIKLRRMRLHVAAWEDERWVQTFGQKTGGKRASWKIWVHV